MRDLETRVKARYHDFLTAPLDLVDASGADGDDLGAGIVRNLAELTAEARRG